MKLFQEMEKCFPEMRKHRDDLFLQYSQQAGSLDVSAQVKRELIRWIRETYLDEHSRLYHLFMAAGICSRHAMAHYMLSWHIYDWNIEHSL